MRRLKPLTLLTSIAGIALLAFAACGDDDDKRDSTPSPTPAVRASATATANPSAPFDTQAAHAHVRALAVDIGSRPTGTEAERRAADYLRGKFEAAGYRVELQQFTFSVNRAASVQVTERNIDASPLQGAPTSEATGPVRFIGLGRAGDIPAEGLRGAVAVADRGDIPFSEKARNAERTGAVALIVVNQTSEAFFGALGAPTAIPIVGVSRDDAGVLRDAAAANVRVTVRIANRTSQPSQNVVARPPNGDCAVVAGGHYDSVEQGPGANDNASGTAVVLAVAETRAARGQRDGVCYVAFGGEELGLHGSEHYVSSLSENQLRALRGMVNLDMVGVGDEWKLIGSDTLQDLATQAFNGRGFRAESIDLPRGFDSDHTPFLQRGVPALFIHRTDDANYHTANDRAEFVQPELLAQAGDITLGVIDRLLARS